MAAPHGQGADTHALRRKPVRELTAGDLRLLLSQQVGVEALARAAEHA